MNPWLRHSDAFALQMLEVERVESLLRELDHGAEDLAAIDRDLARSR